MNKVNTALKAPIPVEGASKVKTSEVKRDPKVIFFASVIDMSWRLAIVVLVPVIGGFELDQHFKTTPGFTIAGFVVAMIGMFFITKQTLVKASRPANIKGNKS